MEEMMMACRWLADYGDDTLWREEMMMACRWLGDYGDDT